MTNAASPPTLVGRDAERARIGALLDAARARRSGALVIRGEPGIGKTALLEDAREQARGMHVLTARGLESESELPFAGLHQLLRPALHLLGELPAPQLAALQGAFGLAERSGDDRFLASAACLTLLSELAEERPVLCLVDDAHWLDDASTDALLFVARRLGAEGIAIIFATREGESRRFAPGDLLEIEVSELDAASAASLLGTRVDGTLNDGVRDLLLERAQGNALALVELPAALSAGQLAGTEALPEALPLTRNVEQLYLARVQRLPEPTQRILLLLAAHDARSLGPVLEAARTVGISPESIDAAEGAGLVQVDGRTFVFRHPLVRSSVYESTSFSERRAAHFALAEAMSGEHDADQRTWHLAAAASGPDEAIAAKLEASATRAMRRGGYTAAAAALERAAGLSPREEARTSRLLAAADAAWTAGKAGRARALLTEASRHSPPELDVQVRKLLGRIEVRSGVFADATAMLLASARELANSDPATAIELLIEAEEATLYTGDIDAVVQIGLLAEQILATKPNDINRVAADVLVGIGLQMGGNFEKATPLLEEAVPLGSTSDDLDEIIFATRVASGLGDDVTSLAYCTRALQLARERGAIGALPRILERVPFYEFRLGRYSSARVHATEGLRLGRDLGQETGIHLCELAIVAGIQGREDECRTSAAEAMERARERRSGLLASMAAWALGLLELGYARPAEALAALEPALPGAGSPTHPIIALFLTPDYIEAAVRCGRIDAARAAVDPFEQWARSVGQPWALALAWHCRGLVSEGEAAESSLMEALALHPRSLRPFEHARTQLALGEQLRRNRKRREAREHLRAALDAFERLSAVSWEERARNELRATGESARKRTPDTIDHLTPQELQISRLVAEGLTNKAIAAQLFLSPRTIDYHLRNVFTKLGITSRTQLARLPLVEPNLNSASPLLARA